MRWTFGVLVLVALGPVAAAHGGGPSTEMRDHDIDVRFPLETGSFGELNFFALANGSIAYSVVTNEQPVYFDLHTHTDAGELRTFVRENATERLSGTFVVPQDGDYSIMVVRNQPGQVEVRLRVEGRFAVESTTGFTIPDDHALPGVAAPLLLIASMAAVAAFRRRR